MHFEHLALGGTFDLFHKGHQEFLLKAFEIATMVTIGLTSDDFAEKLGKIPFENFKKRKKSLENFIKTENLSARAKLIELDDLYGSTVSDPTVEALLVTENTFGGARQINLKRKEAELPDLKVIQTNIVKAADGKPISSTRIRAGEISPEGLNYFLFLSEVNTAHITNDLREELAKLQGTLFQDVDEFSKSTKALPANLITVGDQTSFNFLKKGITPFVSVVDFKVERKQKFTKLAQIGFGETRKVTKCSNPQGQITRGLVLGLSEAIQYGTVVLVEGEEDLAVLPAGLMAKMGSWIIYGQRGQGVVAIYVDAELKRKFINIYKEFDFI